MLKYCPIPCFYWAQTTIPGILGSLNTITAGSLFFLPNYMKNTKVLTVSHSIGIGQIMCWTEARLQVRLHYFHQIQLAFIVFASILSDQWLQKTKKWEKFSSFWAQVQRWVKSLIILILSLSLLIAATPILTSQWIAPHPWAVCPCGQEGWCYPGVH